MAGIVSTLVQHAVHQKARHSGQANNLVRVHLTPQ